MKVLIIHTAYQFAGGEDTVVSEEMKLLKSAGVTVELLLFRNDKNAFLKILQLPFNTGSYIRIRTKLKEFQPDIVHIHNLHFAGSPSVFYAINKSKTPFVTTLHNYRFLCPSGTLFNNGKLFLESLSQNFPWKAVSKGVYKDSKLLTFWLGLSMQLYTKLGTWKMCNRYIVLSQHAKQFFLASPQLGFTNKQVVIKPNFCADPAINKSSYPQDYFLYVGRLSEEKGIRVLLKAFAVSGSQLKIAGDGPLREEVIAFSNKYSNIQFVGKLSKAEVYAMMQNSTALIFPSIWYEGMPLTIIEAFACSTPIIASRLGAMEDMITTGYNGLYFTPENVDDLVLKTEEWKAFNATQKDIYRSNSRQTYLQYYTPEKNITQLLEIYRSVSKQEEYKRTLNPATILNTI